MMQVMQPAPQLHQTPRRAALLQQRAPRRACLRCHAQMQQPEFTGKQFTLLSTGEAATAHLATLLATQELRPGDAYCLKGDARAGKSTFW